VDFVSLTLSTDTVTWSKNPESWAIPPLIKKGFIIGFLNIIEALIWLFIGRRYFVLQGLNELHSFGFAILFFTGIFNILIIRTPVRFYQQPIGKALLYAIIADIVFSFVMLIVGVPGFQALSILLTGCSLLYFLFCSLVINDWIKSKIT
jgi:H+-transporting ATPase